MKNINAFDLTKERPKVLLMGNGFNLLKEKQRTFSLKRVLLDICDLKEDVDFEKVPFPILAMVMGGDKKKLSDCFSCFPYEENEILQEILSLDFDAILTTNYTYEAENVLDQKFLALKDKSRRAATYSLSKGRNRKESSYFIKTYNNFIHNGKQTGIWHLHGELRNRSSLILSHDDSEKLCAKIDTYLKETGKKYKFGIDHYIFESWIDYLLFGDVYIIGFGMDYSEYDLWWVLNQRNRYWEHAIGECVFYEPFRDSLYSKHQLLEKIGVEVEHVNSAFDKHGNCNYSTFYRKAIRNIKRRMDGKGK